MSHQTPFPRTPDEVIARSVTCIDAYKIIYTILFHHYQTLRIQNQSDKVAILRKCNEIAARMHVLSRAFACLAQVATIGFEPTVSIERVAHDYGIFLPFLTGMDLPIDYNIPGRQARGVYDPRTQPR
jgi:hypothetical protein